MFRYTYGDHYGHSFFFQIFEAPALSILPLIIILAVYGSRIKLPFNIPGGFAALMVGVALAWSFRAAGKDYFDPAPVNYTFAAYLPVPCPQTIIRALSRPGFGKHMSTIVPMLIINVVQNLANVESARSV